MGPVAVRSGALVDRASGLICYVLLMAFGYSCGCSIFNETGLIELFSMAKRADFPQDVLNRWAYLRLSIEKQAP